MRRSHLSFVAWIACQQLVGCSGSNTLPAGPSGGASAVGGSSTGSTSASGGAVNRASGGSQGNPSGGAPGSGGSTSGEAGGGPPASGGAATGGGSSASGGMDGGGGISAASGGSASGGAPCVVDHGTEVPSLKDYYANYFAMGAAIDEQYSKYSSLLTKHYNSVTAENQMKFDSLQRNEGVFTFDAADQMVNFATSNGMQVRGHTLVWHSQTPAWVFSGSKDQVLTRMKAHINKVMERYKGKVKVWDVVNEAIMDDGKFRTNNEADGQQSPWYGALGESYIAEAFKAAAAADSTAKLFYNDYYNYHPVRRQAIYNLLKGLLDQGVKVDGVGLQAHLNIAPGTDPNEQSYYQTVENLEEAIEMYSSLGLEVHVTEMDISLYLRSIKYTSDMFYTTATFTPEVQAKQAERYRAFFDMFRKHRDVLKSVTTWGITDDNTWLSEFDSGRKDFPLLFDAQQKPKPAFWAVVDFCK